MKRGQIWLLAGLCAILLAVVAIGITATPPDETASSGDRGSVVISEVMSGNDTYFFSQGRLPDYIELQNLSDTAVDISNYKLSDKESTIGYTFPQGTVLPAGGYLVCPCDSEVDEEGYAAFRISGNGESLYLYNSANVLVQMLKVPALPDNMPYIRAESGDYVIGEKGSPGFSNTDEGYAAWLQLMGVESSGVVISEVQTANRSAVTDGNGDFCDWVELCNTSDKPVTLEGCYLSDDPERPFKWVLPTVTLEAGGFAVICCTGGEDDPEEAPFKLSQNGCTLVLTGPLGNTMDQTQCPALEEDFSWQRMEDGTFCATELFSPGYENSRQGYTDFCQSRGIAGPLAIWEVMSANDRYLVQSDGQYYDWVELKNISEKPIDLADFSISNESDPTGFFDLPEKTLMPGELVVIILSGNTQLTGRYIHAPFSLNKDKCWIYVYQQNVGVSDVVRIQGIPLLGTAGRMDGSTDIVYFATPSPEKENTEGLSSVAADPFVQTPGGIYNDVTQVSVVLSGEGEIRYTLDGSEPTADSMLYSQPIVLTKTATVRARCYCPEKLPGRVVTQSYIINENHTLPVLSISADPEQMFGYWGIYTQYYQNREIPCNMTLYEPDGSFSVDCGIKMFGHTGLQMAKKSFKVNFRGCYGADLLTYPVYGEDGPEVYDSLVIRSGQDYPQAIFRDELFTNLCRQMSDEVLVQRDKFCILYINGDYRGIYCIKEAFSEFFYATNRGVSEQSVQIAQAPVYPDSDVFRFMNYLASHDMTDPDNYAYACSVIDVDSLIDWMIIQGYSTNGDIQQNLRYFRSTENGNAYEMAFYDLDWAFYYHLPFTDVLSNDREMNWQHLRITQRMIRNPQFRQKFLERLSYHMENTLSNENVLATIDYYEQLLSPEVPRERARWGGTYGGWTWDVNRLRRFITDRDHLSDIVYRLVRYIGLTQTEIDQYFRRWV